MTTYIDTRIIVHNGLLDYIDALMCNSCGALVLDQELHDQFHEKITQTALTASRADNTAGMFRPLGGTNGE